MRKILLLICLLLLALGTVQAQDSVNVTLQVDMAIEIAKENFNPATDVVRAAGAFQGWSPGTSPDMVDVGNDGDSVYVMTYRVAANQTYEYKFLIGTDWGKDEFQGKPNRSMQIGATDTTIKEVFFNVVGSYSKVTTSVTFEVDMRLPAKQSFNPSTDHVFVAGNFTDWGTGAIEMDDADNDSVYTLAIDTLTSGQVLIYKFIFSATTAGAGTWESPEPADDILGNGNRIYGIVDGENVVSRFWNNTDPNITLADGNIYFQVDMSVFQEIGIFDVDKDSVRLRSSFGGWSDNPATPELWKMDRGTVIPSEWTLDVPFEQSPVGGAHNFKFFLTFGDTNKAALWPDTYERPASQGGGNRDVAFGGLPDQEIDLLPYDDIKTDYVIKDGKNLQATFRVNMKPATALGIEFNPATDKVYWIPEMPSFVYTQGWVDSDTMRVLELTDADNDSVYEGTLDIEEPSFNTFEYRYAFVTPANEWTQEPSGFGDNAYRIRFIGQDAERSFPVNPWTMPIDTWTNSEVKADQETDPYTTYVISTVQQDNSAVPLSYSLHQNFPNPFNPSTVIKFDLTTKERVALKVYNILGQEVATLVNEDLNPGSYKITFDAKGLASGMYFYRIMAGSFVQTKRMLLLK